MKLADYLLAAEGDYWSAQLASGLSMQEIAKESGLSYRQMYYHMEKAGVRANRRGTFKVREMRGRLLTQEDSASLSSLSPSERSSAIAMIVNDLRAKQSRAISRMRNRPSPTI